MRYNKKLLELLIKSFMTIEMFKMMRWNKRIFLQNYTSHELSQKASLKSLRTLCKGQREIFRKYFDHKQLIIFAPIWSRNVLSQKLKTK